MTSVSGSTTSQAQLALLLQQQLAQQTSSVNDLNNQSSSNSTTGTNSSSSVSVQQSPVAQGVQSLAQALQSNDLSGAQSAYTSLSQLMDGQNSSSSTYGPTGQSSTSTQDPFITALNQVGNDLQSGDLTGAQQTFASIQPPPPPPAAAPPAQSASTGSGASSGSSGSSGSSSSSSTAQPGTVTVLNADGSSTTITTDSSGLVTTLTTPAQNTQSTSGSSTASLKDLLTALQQIGSV